MKKFVTKVIKSLPHKLKWFLSFCIKKILKILDSARLEPATEY